MIIVSSLASEKFGRQLSKINRCRFVPLVIRHFPDGELYVRFLGSVQGENVVIVRGFQPQPQEALVEALFAGMQARVNGAKKITLVAPYLGYIRQDKEFNSGEVVSARAACTLLSGVFDRVVTIDPHLHRIKDPHELFSCEPVVLSANEVVGNFILRTYKKGVIIGPDGESEQWAASIARRIGWEYTVLEKKRFSSRRVKVMLKGKIDVKGKIVVIVDDIVSTGGTVSEAANALRSEKPKKIVVACVHGLFVEDALRRMKRAGIRDITCTNTIHSTYAKIDVSRLVSDAL